MDVNIESRFENAEKKLSNLGDPTGLTMFQNFTPNLDELADSAMILGFTCLTS